MLAINFEKIVRASFRGKLVNEVLLAGSVLQSEREEKEKKLPTFSVFHYNIHMYIVKIEPKAAGQLRKLFDFSIIIIKKESLKYVFL